MNDQQRAAMQMALEALEEAQDAFETASNGGGIDFYRFAKGLQEEITALREALAQPQGEAQTEQQVASQMRNAILEYLVDSGSLSKDSDVYKTIAAQPLDQILIQGETQMTKTEIGHRYDCGNNNFDCAGCESAYWRDLQNQGIKKDYPQIGWLISTW